jgi:hypothetical protein
MNINFSKICTIFRHSINIAHLVEYLKGCLPKTCSWGQGPFLEDL